jgi:hypothetical protein
MTAGKRAFEGSDPASIISAILKREAPEAEPGGLNLVVRGCLEKDPERRIQQMDEVRVLLRDELTELETSREKNGPVRLTRAKTYLTHPSFYGILCSWALRKHWLMRLFTSPMLTIH